jgi:hypothetical protein
MPMRLGIGDASVSEPGVHLAVVFGPQAWCEEAFADDPTWFST